MGVGMPSIKSVVPVQKADSSFENLMKPLSLIIYLQNAAALILSVLRIYNWCCVIIKMLRPLFI